MTTRILGIVVAVACSVSGAAEATTNLKPFNPVALQGVVEATAKELLLPGAMVLLRTPQGDFAFGYGATELGGTTPPRADTHFRAASNTKTMDEPNDLARRPADSQHYHAEDASSRDEVNVRFGSNCDLLMNLVREYTVGIA